MIDHFAAEDIAQHADGETLTQWLARKHGESIAEARARLATMAHVHGRLMKYRRPITAHRREHSPCDCEDIAAVERLLVVRYGEACGICGELRFVSSACAPCWARRMAEGD